MLLLVEGTSCGVVGTARGVSFMAISAAFHVVANAFAASIAGHRLAAAEDELRRNSTVANGFDEA
jgi:hypothetical protein